MQRVIFWLVVVGISVSFLFSWLDMQRRIADSEKERTALQQEVQLYEVENKELERKIESGVDEEQLERDAKEYHDYVGENEQVFIDMS